MTDDFTLRQTQDKLHVFVSSRIGECADERTAVRAAISALNHQPILFEHVGARSYPARDMYLSRLRESQIMVAIYKLGYGYIDDANGMSISGLEDEYRFASKEQIRILAYVYRGPGEREQRLQELVNEAGKRLTLSFYTNQEQLVQRVRDDVTATVTELVLLARAYDALTPDALKAQLTKIENRNGSLILRIPELTKMEDAWRESTPFMLHGLAGSGKTTLASQFAVAHEIPFIVAAGISPKELFEVAARAVAPATSRGFDSPAPTYEAARARFVTAWALVGCAQLAVDDIGDPADLLAAVEEAGGFSASKKAFFIARDAWPKFHAIDVPPLDARQMQYKVPPDVARELETGSHTPLDLQMMLTAHDLGTSRDRLANAPGIAGEILVVLALASRPLLIGELNELVFGPRHSLAELTEELQKINRLVDDQARGLSIVHSTVADAIAEQLRASPQRLAYYIAKLSDFYYSNDEPIDAYMVRSKLGDGSELPIALEAAIEASRLGDWRRGIPLAEQAIKYALDREGKVEILRLMLALVAPLEVSGQRGRAGELFDQAASLASELGNDAQRLVREGEVLRDARRLIPSGIQELEALQSERLVSGDSWGAAQLAVELSASYIATKNYSRAIELLRPAVDAFRDCGDDFGVDCGLRNLIVCLSETDGGDDEARELLRDLENDFDREASSRRHRAWYCNILTRRRRASGDIPGAEEAAMEAIRIAEELGDEALRALNLVNLGNVYRDAKNSSRALETYGQAANAGLNCGRRDIEGNALRLTAGIYNDFPETGVGADRFERAKAYALSAVGLLRDLAYGSALRSAQLELADALEGLGDWSGAADAYVSSAESATELGDASGAGQSLLSAGRVALKESRERYLQVMSEALHAGVLGDNIIEAYFSVATAVLQCAPRTALLPLLEVHIESLLELIPRGAHSAFVERMIERAGEIRDKLTDDALLSLSIGLSKVHRASGAHARQQLMNFASSVEGVDARWRPDGSTWTVSLKLKAPVLVTFESLDGTVEADVACLALACLIKLFEGEIREGILEAISVASEVEVLVCRFDALEAGFSDNMADSLAEIRSALEAQPCAISRPTEFDFKVPTNVVLGRNFFEKIDKDRFGLRYMFALFLVELAHQMLQGEVDEGSLRPKVLAIVQRTLPPQ
ncbi:DUF4062 domain-containing protein [Luteimonas sp. 3794]|uniref:DUF4062 domain-containing protein n=1 Tax=Luteimonas sp. 3794 TaxID=2817730 RepID=UPI0028651C98|nr:DUF4062 domain-containing protein [Luteimonas sp. 3794]MDR6990485.1 tetratricopeptide (TPR) repeat protein [Luteimonas sp. 3794]